MLAIGIMVLRYIFLGLLFLFIFRLVKWMVGDLKEIAVQPPAGLPPVRRPPGPEEAPAKTGAGLLVMASSWPELEPGTSFGTGRELVIGRGGKSDIVVPDTFASTQHARLFLKDEQYWLEDLESTNGTFLNEVQVKHPTVLTDGDRIRVGGVTFQFVRWGYEVGSGN